MDGCPSVRAYVRMGRCMYVYMQVDALQEEVRKLQVLQKDLETKLTLLEGQVSLCARTYI